MEDFGYLAFGLDIQVSISTALGLAFIMLHL